MADWQDDLTPEFYTRLVDWLGAEGVRFFTHCFALTGTVSPVLRLNADRKHIPVHPVHLREGVTVRNYLRSQPECLGWTPQELDDRWALIVQHAVTGPQAGG